MRLRIGYSARMGKKIVLLCLLFSVAAYAEEPEALDPAPPESPLSFGIEQDIVSQYLWHGIPLSAGTVLQSSEYIEYYGVGFSLWSNLVLNDETNQGNVNEIDYTLYYAGQWKDFCFQPAITFYTYPSDSTADTGEILLGLGYTLGPIEIFSNTSVDVIEYDGALFAELGVGFNRQLVGPLSMDTSAVIGVGNATFNRAYLADVGTEFNLVEFSLALPIDVWRALTLTPHVHLSSTPSEALRTQGSDPTIIWGGLKIGYAF